MDEFSAYLAWPSIARFFARLPDECAGPVSIFPLVYGVFFAILIGLAVAMPEFRAWWNTGRIISAVGMASGAVTIAWPYIFGACMDALDIPHASVESYWFYGYLLLAPSLAMGFSDMYHTWCAPKCS